MFGFFNPRKTSENLLEEKKPLCAHENEDPERQAVTTLAEEFRSSRETYLLEEIRACRDFLQEAQQQLKQKQLSLAQEEIDAGQFQSRHEYKMHGLG